MGTEFGSLSTALSALQTERKALEVTGQNIANANTTGYTRQRVDTQALGGSVIPAAYSTSDGIGYGVGVSQVQRLQDSFLESRANTENGVLANATGNQQTLSDIENSFGEPGTTGIAASLSTYWNAWDDVANNPSDTAARTALLGDAQALTAGLNDASASMASQWSSASASLTSTVQQVNAVAANIASLNQAIAASTQAGNQPNDLMDQRDTLIRQLASTLGVTTRAGANGSTDVLLGGSSLVSGSTARQLQVGGATALDQVSSTPVAVTWVDSGTAAAISSGQAGSLLASLNTTIPSYSSQLDGVAAALVTSVNSQQAAGYDLNGVAGGPFFDPTKLTAGTIAVAITDPDSIAASAVAPTVVAAVPPATTPTVHPSLDGSNAQAMANMSGTGADQTYRQMIVTLGSQSQAAQQKTTTQQSVVTQVEASRDASSGVDLDEEQTNLITFQQAYNAAAQYMSVLDSVLDTLINKTLV